MSYQLGSADSDHRPEFFADARDREARPRFRTLLVTGAALLVMGLFAGGLWFAYMQGLRHASVGVADVPLPPGLTSYHLEDLLEEAPDDVRFQLSNGAAQSFLNTLPLLHPRGYLQVQDIFVPTMEEYRSGFRGPGKMDGSVLSWVNGALLRAVAARAGYDVHFAPFHYRANSRTTILYTTPRD